MLILTKKKLFAYMAANIPNTVVQLQGRKNISHMNSETKSNLELKKKYSLYSQWYPNHIITPLEHNFNKSFNTEGQQAAVIQIINLEILIDISSAQPHQISPSFVQS